MIARVVRVSVCVLVACVAAACGGDSASGPATRSPNGFGALVFSRLQGIYELDLETSAVTELFVSAKQSEFVLDPAVSPDNTSIAYVFQPSAKIIDGRYDAGSDLWIMDRDGSDPRPLYKHQQPNALVRYPQWLDDTHVAAIIQVLTTEESATGPIITQVAYTVQSIDIATGERTLMLEDAIAFTFAPGRTEIAYARLDPQAGEVFEARTLPDGAPRVLVDAMANLQPFNSPRYAPDGASVAFAAAYQTAARAPARLASGHPGMSASAGRRGAVVDGLPQDIWLIPAAGGSPRKLAELKEDLPALTWNGDGSHIYVLGANGLHDIEVATGVVRRIGEGEFHAQVDWTP